MPDDEDFRTGAPSADSVCARLYWHARELKYLGNYPVLEVVPNARGDGFIIDSEHPGPRIEVTCAQIWPDDDDDDYYDEDDY